MSAEVVRLVPKRQRVKREAALVVRDAVMSLDELSAWDRAAILSAVHRISEPAMGAGSWPGGYAMLSLVQIGAVWDAIRALPGKDRPGMVRHAFDLVVCNLLPSEGMVMLTRDQFAERLGCSRNRVSDVLGVLVRLGVLERRYVKIDGLSGRGAVKFFVNPHVAWNGRLDVRQDEAKRRKPPLLRLMEGGTSA